MTTTLYSELAVMLDNISPAAANSQERMAALRMTIHAYVAANKITTSEWRHLIEKSAKIQNDFTFRT